MKKTSLIMMIGICVMIVLCGCGPKKPQTAGFLSSYSKLQVVSETTMRYIDEPRLRTYSKFLVDPVVIHLHEEAKTPDADVKELKEHKEYMYWAIWNQLNGIYSIVKEPGPGVVRVRVALTNLKKSSPLLNIIPTTKLAGLGLGAASMEIEIVDSMTGRQLAAAVISQQGERLSLDGLSEWGDAKAIMDQWAKRFGERIDEVYGR
ncbi:MAG: DUF3313 domain-containing protein [Planctomycetota bacterium]|jgi:hypothetical protein